MNLLNAQVGQTYTVAQIDTEDADMDAFLRRLGCYEGEPITVVSKKRHSCIAVIRGSRYNLDGRLARAVLI